MRIRHTTLHDLDAVMELYDAGRRYMREQGNESQWINGYPSRSLVEEDIAGGNSFVCVEGDALLAVFAFFRGEDPTYREIFDGAWPDDAPYGVIHRIAVAKHGAGIADYCYDWCSAQSGVLRADTHKENLPMQKSLLKTGFVRCGVIYVEDGSPREAFQRPAARVFRPDAEKLRRLRCSVLALYAVVVLLASELVGEFAHIAGMPIAAAVALGLALAALLLWLCVRFVDQNLPKHCGIILDPAGITDCTRSAALHYDWSQITDVRLQADGSSLWLRLQDAETFFAALTKEQRRVLTAGAPHDLKDAVRLDCRRLPEPTRHALQRAISAALDAQRLSPQA